jgi:hypothetical protein
MYIGSEHYQQVKAATAPSVLLKAPKGTYVNRVDQKNYHIMRHVFERLRETCGVYDGLRSMVNYSKTGSPKKLRVRVEAGKSIRLIDVHLVHWQEELINQGLILPEEMLSSSSVEMMIAWCVATQKETKTFAMQKVALTRRAAMNAYWLLSADLIELEKSNFFGVTSSGFVTPEPVEDVIESGS